MDNAIELSCNQHTDIYSCPDVLIRYTPKFDEYGIIIHDGGSAASSIKYCPWCGQPLPESKRDKWFETLERLGFDDPSEQEIPEQYKSDMWYQNT
jgi:hypothetical protein